MNRSFSKIRHIQESNSRLEKRMLSEQVNPVATSGTIAKPNQQTSLTNNVAKEGLKNVTPQMVESPPFDGTIGAYSFGGTFNGVEYLWNCNGVEDMGGVRGFDIPGKVISDKNEILSQLTKEEVTDAQKGGNFIGFVTNGSRGGFVIYTTTSNKPKCINY
jgi:hypothetical protein